MNEQTTPLEQIVDIRKEKLQKFFDAGINPYPATYAVSSSIAACHEAHQAVATGQTSAAVVSLAGRLISRREMGKASFVDLRDGTGRIQLYFKADIVGVDSYRQFKELVDLADFVGVQGSPFRTRTGELSILVNAWTLLGKALRPLPEKWHGLKDTETRYRQRYLDLLSNPDVKDIFVKRSKIIWSLRRDLEAAGFLEVETPMMQPIAGGAAARPFLTHHNALDMDLYLRIAPELYLKRLVAGGLERVYEIGRNFRNEGIDRNHNPEFTMLELYQAYVDYHEMMRLAEQLIASAAQQIGAEIALPFRRLKFFDALQQATGRDLLPLIGTGALKEVVTALALELPADCSDKKLLDHMFDELIVPTLVEPTFVIDYPAVFSPLSKAKFDQPAIAERFELYMNGMEIANAYSEMNNPLEQKKRFEEQMEAKKQGDEEAQPYDADYITALEHGLPPTGGLGIGVDRLVMVLGKIDAMREVVLFPLLRQEV